MNVRMITVKRFVVRFSVRDELSRPHCRRARYVTD